MAALNRICTKLPRRTARDAYVGRCTRAAPREHRPAQISSLASAAARLRCLRSLDLSAAKVGPKADGGVPAVQLMTALTEALCALPGAPPPIKRLDLGWLGLTIDKRAVMEAAAQL